MERILITGGCGFIGANLIAYLAKRGTSALRVFDNESLGTREHIAEFDVEFVHGDVCDTEALRTVLDSVDAVVHLAADTRVMDSIENPTHNFRSNVIGTFKLLTCMREAGVTRLVNASTGGAILGEAVPPIHEGMVPIPPSPYGASKLAAEGYCSAFTKAYGFVAASLRFSNVYGPRSYHKGSVVAHFFKRILAGQELIVYGDGNQTRDYVFIEDLCAGIQRAIELCKSGIYQLGTGQPTTINELIELIRQTVGSTYPIRIRYTEFRPGEIRHTWCDINKARVDLGYDPSMPLEEGFKRTWDWFRDTYRTYQG